MAGSTVTRWVISEDGSHLIRREDLEASFPKGAEQGSHRLRVKAESSDRPVTSCLSISSLSTNKRNAVPAQLPVSYPCAYCDICFTASHYLEKHIKRSHRKQYLEMLRCRDATLNNASFSPSAPSGSSSSSHTSPLSSLTSVPAPARGKSTAAGQSQVARASDSTGSPTVSIISHKTAVRVSNHTTVPPASNSMKASASVPSPCSAQITVPIPKEAPNQGAAQALSSASESKRSTLFLCNECGQSFPSFLSLSSHQDQTHWGKGKGRGEEEEGETLYLCAECGLSFPRLDLLRDHQSLHDSPGARDGGEGTEEDEKGDGDSSPPSASQAHSCPNCQKIFKTARYLKTHMKIHSGQVPYHCDQCDKPFTQLGDLKTHRRTHTGERPYQCSQCGKCFGRSGTLKKHWRTHTGETPYVCAVCGKQFNQLGALKTHERIHTGLRPYFCSRCSQHFTYSYQLKRHRCVHPDKN
ncbi:zinc finger protein 91-like [Megalops cyprinoides]|uniref:zinc finger protein 91-like n=1 Tax=Megalops cyprinoides TaxID=118141 RepID=UPI001863BAA4|nr:zinc finger protein 91-like [Megalops cyprinoides]